MATPTVTASVETAIASRLAQLAAGWASRETADMATDAAMAAFASAQLTLGASGYATVAKTGRSNEYGTCADGLAALMYDVQSGRAGQYRRDREFLEAAQAKAAQRCEDAAMVAEMLTQTRGTVADEMRAEVADASCAACARLSAYGTMCRTHSR